MKAARRTVRGTESSSFAAVSGGTPGVTNHGTARPVVWLVALREVIGAGCVVGIHSSVPAWRRAVPGGAAR